METKSGCLFIVPTPIGNLKDITLRALDVLASVDWIAAEDTRHSKKLLQHFGINTRLISLHDHNEQSKRFELLSRLQAGEQGALISDAGTPLISDPGYHLVSLLREQAIRVTPLPGPNAMITALSASGLPTNRFSFEGFLPAKAVKKEDTLRALNEETRTMVFYESPHRILMSLKAMSEVFGCHRQVSVGRELTKTFEQFVAGSLEEVESYFVENEDKVRGEFVVVVAGTEKQVISVEECDGLIRQLVAQNLPMKQISEIVAEFYGVKKKTVYQRAQAIKDNDLIA